MCKRFCASSQAEAHPTVVALDSRALQSTFEFGTRAGYDRARHRRGSKVHIAVNALGHLMALTVAPGSRSALVAG